MQTNLQTKPSISLYMSSLAAAVLITFSGCTKKDDSAPDAPQAPAAQEQQPTEGTGTAPGPTDVAVENPSTVVGELPPSEQVEVPSERPAARPEPDSWAFKLMATCAAQEEAEPGVANDQCVGAYGFTADTQGNFKVGPGPRGQMKEGKLKAEESAKIKALLPSMWLTGEQQLALPEALAETCADVMLTDSNDSITLIAKSQEKVFAKTNGKTLCSVLELERAAALRKEIQELAARYYVLPFGDECADTLDALEKTYDTFGACQADVDCAYVDYDFYLIDANYLAPVVVSDGSIMKLLPVSNAEKVKTDRPALVESWNKAWHACGERVTVSPTSEWKTFQNDVGAPVCASNRCQVNPAALPYIH